MSVDYSLRYDGDEWPARLAEPMGEEGGTYAVGGSEYAELNVTYNYSHVWVRVLGDEFPGMVEMLHGRKAGETVPVLARLCAELPDEPGDDYWQPTPGNAGHAAALLLRMAREHPEAVWEAHG